MLIPTVLEFAGIANRRADRIRLSVFPTFIYLSLKLKGVLSERHHQHLQHLGNALACARVDYLLPYTSCKKTEVPLIILRANKEQTWSGPD